MGRFGLFESPVYCKISKKLKGDPLETIKNFQKKTNENFEKVSVPENSKGETL